MQKLRYRSKNKAACYLASRKKSIQEKCKNLSGKGLPPWKMRMKKRQKQKMDLEKRRTKIKKMRGTARDQRQKKTGMIYSSWEERKENQMMCIQKERKEGPKSHW